MNQHIKLYQSLYILQKCNVVLQRVVSRTRSTVDGKLDLIADDEFLVDNTMLIILQLTIFLDEYEKHFQRVELGYQQRVIIFKKIVSLIINQIKMWKDLRKVRNLFVAHNFCDHSGKFYPHDFTLYNVPTTTLDYHIASDYMNYIDDLMGKEFEKELVQMTAYIMQFNPPKRMHHNIQVLNPQLLQMKKDVDNLCQQYNKPYIMSKIMLYNPPDKD